MDAEELGMQQALLRKGSNRNTAAGGLEEAISRRCACASQDIEEGGARVPRVALPQGCVTVCVSPDIFL